MSAIGNRQFGIWQTGNRQFGMLPFTTHLEFWTRHLCLGTLHYFLVGLVTFWLGHNFILHTSMQYMIHKIQAKFEFDHFYFFCTARMSWKMEYVRGYHLWLTGLTPFSSVLWVQHVCLQFKIYIFDAPWQNSKGSISYMLTSGNC